MVEELLPLCTAEGRLGEAAVMRVCDLAGDLRGVAGACLADGEGVAKEVGEEGAGKGVVEFWREEWVAE